MQDIYVWAIPNFRPLGGIERKLMLPLSMTIVVPAAEISRGREG